MVAPISDIAPRALRGPSALRLLAIGILLLMIVVFLAGASHFLRRIDVGRRRKSTAVAAR